MLEIKLLYVLIVIPNIFQVQPIIQHRAWQKDYTKLSWSDLWSTSIHWNLLLHCLNSEASNFLFRRKQLQATTFPPLRAQVSEAIISNCKKEGLHWTFSIRFFSLWHVWPHTKMDRNKFSLELTLMAIPFITMLVVTLIVVLLEGIKWLSITSWVVPMLRFIINTSRQLSTLRVSIIQVDFIVCVVRA